MEEPDMNENSSIEIMNYLTKKLESSCTSLLKFNRLLDSFDTSDTFFTLRKDLKLLFNDLIENFNQGIFAIKALTNQNKKILEEIKIKDDENKKIIEQLNNTVNENKNLKTQVIKIKDKEIKENLEKEEINNEINNIKEIKENNNKNNYNDFNNDLNNNNIVKNGNNKTEDKYKKNKYEFEQLSNIRNIMDNKKINKMKLKMAIQQHLTNNQEQDINNNDNNNDNY